MLRISKKLWNKEEEAKACNVLVKSYFKEGNNQESRKYAKELLRISNELVIKNKKPKRVLSVKSYCKEGNDQESRKYVKELLRISKELGNKEQEAEACVVSKVVL